MLRFSEGAAPEKYARLREAMGLKPGADLADAVAELTVRLGLPTTLLVDGDERCFSHPQ